MRPPEFESQIARLSDAFGKPGFTSERVALIYKYCGSLRAHQFTSIVDHFIATHRQAPLPQDFLKAYYEEKKREYQNHPTREAEHITEIECHDCYMTGWMFIKTKPTEPTVILHCSCQYGKILAETRGEQFIPRWDKCDVLFAWIRIPFPVKAFIPNTEERQKLLSTGFSNIVERWNQKKKEAEKYWRELREKIESEGA
jgi:hypothetical protein